MFQARSLKLLVLFGLAIVILVAIRAGVTTAAVTSQPHVLTRQDNPPNWEWPVSPARVRAEIPSNFIQPVVPYDSGGVSMDDLRRAPHTIRDLIPSNFIQPLEH